MRWAPQPTLCWLSYRAVRSVVCRQDSTLKLLVIPLYVILFASRALSSCKHDVGTLSWLNAETVERAPTPLFGRLVRCSAHGPFFGRLRYIPTFCPLIAFTREYWYLWVCIFHTCTHILAHNVAFVIRFTAEELPRHMKKHIEEDLQEWEENLCKVWVSSELVSVVVGIRSKEQNDSLSLSLVRQIKFYAMICCWTVTSEF